MRSDVVSTVHQLRGVSRRALLVTLALSGCTAGPTELGRQAGASLLREVAPVAGTPRVRISQVYGGGGNSGAPFRNDFIELYNSGDSPQLLTGWSVQYTSATGTGNFGANAVVSVTGTLQPGQYYLVQLAGGANGSVLPTPDATGTINMSATAGKAVLVKSTTGLACNGGSTVCSGAQLALIEDLVGYGSANFFEGAAAAPTLSNTTAALRKNSGAMDTDNNGADFEAGAPNPRNTLSGRPTVTATTPTSGATGVAVGSNLTVTFSRPVTVTGTWFTVACTSGPRTGTVTGGPSIYTIDPSSDFTTGDTCTVTIAAAQVADQAAPASTMAADFVWSFQAGDAASCDAPFTAAFAIQGSGAISPLAGQLVTTKGVVVGDFEGPSPALRGFYVQDVNGDGNPVTSDAVFVFNNGDERVSVGDLVRVSGTVAEFQEQTQIGASDILACGTGTVSPVTVSLPATSATDLERFEGMTSRPSRRLPSVLVARH